MNKNNLPLFIPIICLVLLSTLSGAAFAKESSTCYVRGYAYDYSSKTYIYSNQTSYRYIGDACPLMTETYARNEWHGHFKAEAKDYFKYTIGVHTSCSCHGDHKKARRYVKESYQGDKENFGNKDFRFYKLYGFSVEDWD